MSTFSERMGITQARTAVQLDDMDSRLRNALWNVVTLFALDDMEQFIVRLWHNILRQPTDEVESLSSQRKYDRIRSVYFDLKWNEVYDFLEFAVQEVRPPDYRRDYGQEFRDCCNQVMEAEASGYRFVGGVISPITAGIELDAIDEALAGADSGGAARNHIANALRLLSDRETPDYANSVKEAISAVEAGARQITSDPKATLADALKLLRTQHDVHPALMTAFDKLYGYTSDAGGIRHAATDGRTVDFADAKFMLVTCSAFVNYLRQKVPTGAGPSS